MNDEQHARYSAYLRALGDSLLLRDWEIELRREWSADDTYAMALSFHKENHLWVRISEGFDGHPAADRREWLIHELLHAHLSRIDRCVEHLSDALPDNDAVKIFTKHIDDEIEVAVQRLARILAPTLPLPPNT